MSSITIHFTPEEIQELRFREEFAFLEDREIIQQLVKNSIQLYLANTHP